MRKSAYGIDPFFKERFSPKEFSERPVGEGELYAILEAASTAPSCYNEQPWRFVLGKKEAFLTILAPGNVEWAAGAACFVLVCCEENFSRNGKPNGYAAFDSGTAWGYMTMQAYKRGIMMHAMAGFDATRAMEVFDLGSLKPLAVVAVGYSEEPHTMTPRKALKEILLDRR